jgi:phosphatidylinositol-3-phosphatase
MPRLIAPVLPCSALLGLSLLAAGCGAASAGRPLAVGPPARLPVSRASHAVIVVMENTEYGGVIGNPSAPYANALARRYGLATDSHAITHPSLPNYLALTSGSTDGIESDCTDCVVSAPNIVDQLTAAGISWKAYLEGVTGPCFEGAQAGGYAKKHNPFAYYRDIAGHQGRCSKLVGFDALARDLRAGTLPTFAWISPNLCDDGHDCAVGTADRFLARTLPALLHELGPSGMLILTWDEGSTDSGCCGVAHGGHVATIVAGPGVRPGAREGRPLDHYGVLATIERALGLPPLAGAADPRAGSLLGLFARAPRLR